VVNFPQEVVEGVLKQLPPEWLENDQRALEKLVDTLMRRRNRVPDLISGRHPRPLEPFSPFGTGVLET
jgi:hypothetical protein